MNRLTLFMAGMMALFVSGCLNIDYVGRKLPADPAGEVIEFYSTDWWFRKAFTMQSGGERSNVTDQHQLATFVRLLLKKRVRLAQMQWK